MNKSEFALTPSMIARETVIVVNEMDEYDATTDQRGICVVMILVVFWLILSGLMIWKIMLSE